MKSLIIIALMLICAAFSSATDSPPIITMQPSNVTVGIDHIAYFEVGITGSAPFTFQWLKNGMPIPGANGYYYYTPPATAADNGEVFALMITNPFGGVTSANAILTVDVTQFGPTIITQPANQTVAVRQSATFSVVVIGTAPLVYQWYRNGNAIAGATSASYTTPPCKLTDSGAQFGVVITNSNNGAMSYAALLTVARK